MVDRLVKEMGVEGRKSAYESVLQPEAVKRLSMKNDPVLFLDELTKVFARHPNWTMPKDQLNGTAPASPRRDGLSDLRVAVFMRLLPDSSMVKMAFANNHSTRVPTIDGREVVKMAKDLTITEWMRVFLRETAISETSKVAAQHTLERLKVESGEGWAAAARVVLLHKRAAMVDPNRPFLVEEDYFWKVLSETDAMGICRRIVGMVAPHDTDKFEAPLYDVQAQWESLRAYPVNTGQLLDLTMELRGRKACDIFNKFVEKINMRSSDFSDPKVPAKLKARGTQASVSAFGGTSGGRSSRNESRMGDIFGVGHMRGGHNQNLQGPETRGASWRDKQNSRKRDGSLSSYEVREQRPKLDIAALASEPSDEEDVADSKMRDELMQWLAAYSTQPASLPVKGGTPFVPTSKSSRRQGAKPPQTTTSASRRWQKEGDEQRTMKHHLPLPLNTAAKAEIEEALRSRNICFFHARGQDCPFLCRFSREEGDVAYSFYRNTVQKDAKQPTNQTSYDMIVAYDLAGKGPPIPPPTPTDDTDGTAK
eukprot:jgi/Undpi1/7872/HiC_scaffold_24.g10344.m1